MRGHPTRRPGKDSVFAHAKFDVDERSGHRGLLRPLEYCTVYPNAVEDDGKFASDRDLGLFRAGPLHQPDTPGLQWRPASHFGQQHPGGFIKAGSLEPVAAPGYASRQIEFT